MRPPVRILSEELANQIAAGEVVERPASVLKELVENALDAGAGRVAVEVAAAGRRLIRVVDDGWGMTPDDLLTALERHATSKLSTAQDLEGVLTLGFRGEALPSIAAVSKMRLTSRPEDQETGSQVTVQGGAIREVKEVGCRPGTTIEVADLFFNTPARRKFLKTRATEAGHLGAAFLRLALARPDVSFRYRSEGQVLYDLPAGADLAERAAILLGREAAGQMIALDQEAGPIKVTGLLGLPSLSRSGPDQIFTFVNRRFVRDRILMHAIGQAYRGFMPDGRRPVLIVNIQVDPTRVDVNVHPAKVEVRFRESQEVHAALVQCLRRGLAQAPKPQGAQTRRPEPGAPPPPAQWRDPARDLPRFEPPTRPAAPAMAPAMVPAREAAYQAPAPAASAMGGRQVETPTPAEPEPLPTPGGGLKPRPLFGAAGDLTYLSQLHGLYLLCSSPHGLVIIDQHAAHERLSYQQLLGALQGADHAQPGAAGTAHLGADSPGGGLGRGPGPGLGQAGPDHGAFRRQHLGGARGAAAHGRGRPRAGGAQPAGRDGRLPGAGRPAGILGRGHKILILPGLHQERPAPGRGGGPAAGGADRGPGPAGHLPARPAGDAHHRQGRADQGL